MFRVVRSTSRFLYLASPQDEPQSFQTKQNKVNFFPGVLSSCKSLLKRKLFGERENDDPLSDASASASSSKKPKINPSPEEAIELAFINPQECVLLIHHHAFRILELKDEFLQQKNISKIIEGVSKSRILKLGNVHTVFTLLEPKSYTEYSSCNFDLNFILCDGESVVLKTMTRTEDEQFHENDPSIENEPFKLPMGSYYSLENNHRNQSVLLRAFWVENDD